ncbi:MAG TPA: hypothetical protein VH593_25230 [Ktedonobacteraceae bacterium]|jgi:hypothetical protein
MRCSQCSALVKPVAVVDIDGTIGNYHAHFYRFCRRYWGIPSRNGQWDGYGEFEDWIGINKEQYREAKLAYRQGGLKRWMPVYAGAQAMASAIVRHDIELWLVTTRPWLRVDNIHPDTKWWLERNEIAYDFLLYGNEDKYERLLENVELERVIGVLEDLPDQFDAAAQLGLPVYMRINKHNRAREAQRQPSISLDGFEKRMLQAKHEWEMENARADGSIQPNHGLHRAGSHRGIPQEG